MGVTPSLNLPFPESLDTADVPRDIKALADALEQTTGVLPAGVIQMWPGNAAPAGWALCNGGTVPVADNPKLAAIFGSAGGNVTLPDFSARFPVGPGFQTVLRTTGGQNARLLAVGELPDHTHVTSPNGLAWSAPLANAGWTAKFAKEFNGATDPAAVSVVSGGNGTATVRTGAREGAAQTPVDMRPQYYCVNFIIKLG